MRVDPRIEAALPDWLKAGRGHKGEIIKRLAHEIGRSPQTVYSQLKHLVAGARERKRRRDAGASAMSAGEAVTLATMREETRRQTGTGVLPMGDAVEIARANGLIAASRVDASTGERTPLSLSTVRRALRKHYMHESQLAAATPATRLSSPHPNYLWQIDASISSQYYLADDGMRPMPKAQFYRGKPQNFERISDRRLWRYITTDHASGCMEVIYVLGAESAANLTSALIQTMTQRPSGTMHGVPLRLMADPGSAMTSSTTRNLLYALGVELIINEVHNARAKGQVENAHYICETHFEATLALNAPMTSLEQINTHAQRWARAFNATRTHSRTGMTRRDGWLRITREQLATAPPIEVLRQLPNSAPKLCTVRDCLIRFKSNVYDVRGIPGLLNGSRVNVIVNALDPSGSIRVLMPGEQDDRQIHYIAPCIEQDDWGFLATAARVGAEYKARPQTPADAARKEMERVAMEVDTDAEAASARKAKRLPFGGRIDPLKHVNELEIPPALPRASVRAHIDAPRVVDLTAPRDWPQIKHEFPPLDHVEAARRIKPLVERAGLTWTAEMYARTAERWPDGVPVDQVEAWAAELMQQPHNGLRLVQGGAA